MAFQRSGKSKGSGPNGTSVRVTGLFGTKRKGLFVGSLNDEKIQELVKLIKKAISSEKEITVFLWKSKFEEGPRYSLNMDLAQDRAERDSRKPKRRIEEDDDDEPADDDDDEKPAKGNDPFEDD